MIDFQLLGPVRIKGHDGGPVATQSRQQALLAALLVDAGRLVPYSVLIDRVWGADPPQTAGDTLRSHISRIRRLLKLHCRDPAPILSSSTGGYRLDVDRNRIDIHRFTELAGRGRSSTVALDERIALFREALALWESDPLSGLAGEWPSRTRQYWRQRHRDLTIDWAQAEMESGNAAAAVSSLADLAAGHPLDESVAAVLMRALYAVSRQADALSVYESTRHRLRDELGVDPGIALRAIHGTILRGDVVTGGSGTESPRRSVPALLPTDINRFAGRRAEMATLNRFLSTSPQSPVAVAVVVSGMAGVGKTTLAVHWAHQVCAQFPDGQLYLDLRGFDPSGSTVPTADAVRRLLYALGTRPQEVPRGFDAQVDLYRTKISGRRLLLVLDNAKSADHIRPLLPGASTVAVVVTSRDRLLGLIATHALHEIALNPLPVDEARELLQSRLGRERTEVEPAAVDDIIGGTGGLPLALAIVSSRAVARPHSSLADLAAELSGTRSRLDALSAGEPAADARASLSWSYRTLTTDAARMLRLLTVSPGPDIGLRAAASLAGLSTSETGKLLTGLVHAHLISEPRPDRYALHSLVRAYADEQTRTGSATALVGDGAIRRLLDYYLHSLSTADDALNPALEPVALPQPEPAVIPERPVRPEHALTWLTTERMALLAAIRHAAEYGLDVHASKAAIILINVLDAQGYWHDQADMARIAVAATVRMTDPSAEAQARRLLGYTHMRLELHTDAERELTLALDLYRATGNQVGEAHTYYNRGQVAAAQSKIDDAIGYARRALHLYQATEHARGQANTLNALGWYLAESGRSEDGLAYCEKALGLHSAVDNLRGMANTHDSLGYAHYRLGNHIAAIDHYQEAATLCKQLGDRYYEANISLHIGDAFLASGRRDAADDAWRQALAILDQIGHPHAALSRRRLRAASETAP
jgi:DNA-binding SARP family transcriptional activator